MNPPREFRYPDPWEDGYEQVRFTIHAPDRVDGMDQIAKRIVKFYGRDPIPTAAWRVESIEWTPAVWASEGVTMWEADVTIRAKGGRR